MNSQDFNLPLGAWEHNGYSASTIRLAALQLTLADPRSAGPR